MVVSLAGSQNVKMVSFDVVTSLFNVISNSRRVIMFQKGLEMIRFPVVKSSLRIPNVKIVAVILLKMYVDWHTKRQDNNWLEALIS